LEVTGLLSLHDAPTQWHELATLRNFWLTCPGIVCGVGLLVMVMRVRHYLAMPLSLLAIPLGFYAVLLGGGIELEQLAVRKTPFLRHFCTKYDHFTNTGSGQTSEKLRTKGVFLQDTNSTPGWIAPLPTEAPPPFWTVWQLFFNRVYWSALPSLFPTWLSMYFVVAFGSCLDVAAISLDMGQRLDYNHELKTVGVSNLVSGLLGGFTGSYIFSLTTFTYRSATNSRMVGFVLCIAELLLFISPVNVAAFLPHFFFGAVLVFIAIDLMLDWLVHSFHKVSMAEYAIVWATFLAISLVGLQEGMGIGLAISVVQFVLSYARVRKSRPVSTGSKVMRGFLSRRVLAQAQETIAVFELTGYIFFGSVVQIVADIEANVRVAATRTAAAPATAVIEDARSGDAATPAADRDRDPEAGADGSGALVPGGLEASTPTAYVVIDLQGVAGVDATAARSCFLALLQLLRPHGIPLCLAHVTPALERLLRAHDVIRDDFPDECRCFGSTSEAVEWCEANILLEQGILSPGAGAGSKRLRPQEPLPISSVQHATLAATSSLSSAEFGSKGRRSAAATAGLQHVLVQFAEGAATASSGCPPDHANVVDNDHVINAHDHVSNVDSISWVEVASRYFESQEIACGSTVFRAGDTADCIYVLEHGSVTLLTHTATAPAEEAAAEENKRLLRYANGGIFGELDFFLGQARSFDAVAGSDCSLHMLRREAYARLVEEEPVVGAALQGAVLKHLCLETHTVLMSSVIK
jgi:SulP family sulfate permease